MVSSGIKQPHAGQLHETPLLRLHDFFPRILLASGSKWILSNTISLYSPHSGQRWHQRSCVPW